MEDKISGLLSQSGIDLVTGKIDSLKLVMLVVDLQNEFDIKINPLDIVEENFLSINSIKNLIERCKQ